MSLEPGGIADKAGNKYENRYLAYKLVSLCTGSIQSIKIEPAGSIGEGIEFYTTNESNQKTFYQCKLSNGEKSFWSVKDLNRAGVMLSIKKHLLEYPDSSFVFVTPLQCTPLSDLFSHSHSCENAEEFYELKIHNGTMKEALDECCDIWEFDKSKPEDRELMFHLFKNSFFEITDEKLPFLDEVFQAIFNGNPVKNRLALEGLIHEKRAYSKTIIKTDLDIELSKLGITKKEFIFSKTVLEKVEEINNSFWENKKRIKEVFYNRKSFEHLKQCIDIGNSVVLTGTAGSGKSCHLDELSKYLDDESIPYLRIKLDRRIPTGNTKDFGDSLGLEMSPVDALLSVSGSNKCVLILDQFDALRWSSYKNTTCFDVCREMLSEIDSYNRNRNSNIVTVISCRSVDLKSDETIFSMFHDVDKLKTGWVNVEVTKFDHRELESILGDDLTKCSTTLLTLLKTPLNLYLWLSLQKYGQYYDISNVQQLIENWYLLISKSSPSQGISSETVSEVISKMVLEMETMKSYAVPKRNYISQIQVMEYLMSEGVIEESDRKYSFIHQIVFDYFYSIDKVKMIKEGDTNIVDLIGPSDNQIPSLRSRIRILLDFILDDNESLFISIAKEILASDNVRFYFKAVVFESLSQYDRVSKNLMSFIYEYYQKDEWHNTVFNYVILGDVDRIKSLFEIQKFDIENADDIRLVRSISGKAQEYALSILPSIEEIDILNAKKVFGCLPNDVNEDDSEIYRYRIALFDKFPSLFDDYYYVYLYSDFTDINILSDYIRLYLQYSSKKDEYFMGEKHISKYVDVCPREFVQTIFPLVIKLTKTISAPRYYEINYNNREWLDGSVKTSNRIIIDYLKKSIELVSKYNEEELIQTILQEDYSTQLLGNELQLTTLLSISETYSDYAIDWLIGEFPMHLFDYTGSPKDYLDLAYSVINKHSSTCAIDKLRDLEKLVFSFALPSEECKRIIGLRRDYHYYYSHWGHLQKRLLPAFDSDRLSKNCTDLIAVLNRNKDIDPHYFKADGFSETMVFSPVSPFDERIDFLSDETWLRIISTPEEKWNAFPKNRDYYVETTAYSFSRSLEKAAKKDTVRFSDIALRMPLNVNPTFISTLINVFSETRINGLYLNHDKTELIIKRFFNLSSSVDVAICNLIMKRSAEAWSDEIIDYLFNIPNKEYEDESPVTDDYSLFVYNNPHGLSILALTYVLDNHDDLKARLFDRVNAISSNENIFIQYACLFPLTLYLDEKTEQIVEFFKSLAYKDLHICSFPYLWQFIKYGIKIDRESFLEILWSLLELEDKLSVKAASILCAIGIFSNDQKLIDQLLSSNLTENDKTHICIQASSTLYKHKTISQNVILGVLNIDENVNPMIDKDYYIDNFNSTEDSDFFITLFSKCNNKSFRHVFIHYLQEYNGSIVPYSSIIQAVVKTFKPTSEVFDYAIEDLMKISLKLYEEALDDSGIVEICLDIWDKLFLNNNQYHNRLERLFDSNS